MKKRPHNWVGFHPRGSPPDFKWPKFGLTAPSYDVQTQAFRVFFEAYTSGTCKTLIDGFLKTILTEDAGHTVDQGLFLVPHIPGMHHISRVWAIYNTYISGT